MSLLLQVEMEVGFGTMRTIDLLPGGGDIPVTAANRAQYVELYTQVHHWHRGYSRGVMIDQALFAAHSAAAPRYLHTQRLATCSSPGLPQYVIL
jgi:hypothetical protein